MENGNYYGLRKNVLRELADGFSCIHDNFKFLKGLSKDKYRILGAAEWILDNIYLIEKEYKSIKREMPLDYFKGLPSNNEYLSKSKLLKFKKKEEVPHIFVVAKNYINESKNFELDNLVNYINSIQNSNLQKPFTMGELWAFPLMLRSAVIINLSIYTNEIVKVQKEFIEESRSENGIVNAINKTKIKNMKEESLERNIAEYITAIRKAESVNWKMFFEKTSLVEKVLCSDPVNVYNGMDFQSKDYYRHKLEDISRVINKNELSIAENVLKLAVKAYEDREEDYKCHVGYYLIDEGINELQGHYYGLNALISPGSYLGLNIGGTFIIGFLILFMSAYLGAFYTLNQFILSYILILIPINEIIIGLTNWIVSRLVKIRFVPKLDFSKGIPYNDKTIVVIPAIINNKEKIKELIDKLEVYYLGNKDDNIRFALLSDFEDSDKEVEDSDEEIIDFALQYTKKLNNKYKLKIKDRFFFFSRKRIYDKKQKTFMGKERKRGKLMEFMALIKGNGEHTYNVISSDISELKEMKYLITLDEDTFMPRETVYKLVGAMSHLLNIPYIKNNKIIRGYGIMQPKVSISLEAKNKSYFAKIFGGESGVDGYSVAYSDTYQDLFGEGTFVGKGIINIDEFYGSIHNFIKDDRILSHDLLEGALARCALVSDIELIDGYPASYECSCKRLHRWVRGDWQLIGWLFSRKISILNKWKIFDNMRRSLLSPNLLLGLLISLTLLNGRKQVILLCFLALITPLVFTVTDFVVTPKNKLMGTFKTFQQVVFILAFIPYQAYLMISAILVTLFRVCISRKNLLEWQSSQIAEMNNKDTLKSYMLKMWISPLVGILVIYLSLFNSLGVAIYGLVVGILWVIAPYIAYFISQKIVNKEIELDDDEKDYLREISRRIYAYYEDFVNEENNYLAPDNYQEKPYKGIAHRTSPTNIGMGIIANAAAYDLGYITMGELIDKSMLILENMRDLEKVNGHYLNWYDTRTKKPLWPRYVSTVDNGNLLSNLWLLKRTMEQLRQSEVIRVNEVSSLKDIYKIIEEECSDVKIRFASKITIGDYDEVLNEILTKLKESTYIENNENEEFKYWIDKLISEVNKKLEYHNMMFSGLEKLYSEEFLEGVPNLYELIEKCSNYKKDYGDNFKCTLGNKIEKYLEYTDKIENIIREIDSISAQMNFRFLYDENRQLFSIGYNVEENSLGNSFYDLLASESRIASFVSIAKNDVSKDHWFKLSRAMTNAFHTHCLVSWSGTMFEYFMPSLIMKSYPGTLFSKTYKSVIKAQKSFAKQKKVPWGISESAFYEFDIEENYQYKAFGIPGLGLKRGLEDEVVVSPYSTLMTLPFSKKKGIKNLQKLEGGGALGRYGFIESIDYTKAREDKFIYCLQSVNTCGKPVDNFEENCDKSAKDKNVDNVDNLKDKNEKLYDTRGEEQLNGKNNAQISVENEKNFPQESYPQDNLDIYDDGIKPNRIFTYMVHHLGMSLMALDNVLLDNILINRFHELPEVKATELLLKEKVPHFVTFERNEDFSIKNRYFEGDELAARKFAEVHQQNPQVLLLSNGEYSLMINQAGSGYSKKNDMMLYRWNGNTTSDDSGMFFYIKNLNSNDYWSSTFEPCKDSGDGYAVEFNLDKAKFNRIDGNIETQTEIVLSSDDDFELRKLTLNNLGDKGRSIEVTSYMEVTLTSFSADVVHPAFSNLFIQTEYDEDKNVLLGSRRGRVKGAKVPYIFHTAIIDGELEGNITYETSRINFLGRNRKLKDPAAMDNDKALANTVGTVLDPILSMRVRVRLEAYEKREIYFLTGTCDSRERALEICDEYKRVSSLERLFNKYTIAIQLELKNLEIKSFQANMYQSLASYMFYIHSGRKDREYYIKNISKHQNDLWAYGISGDLPIIMMTIENEEDINNVVSIIKFHQYMKLKGVKSDLIIYNNEEVSYDAPLQKSIAAAINICNQGSDLNKNAGIYICNKSTMGEEIKDFLIGIARIYFDSNKGSILEQINKDDQYYNSEVKDDLSVEENNNEPLVKNLEIEEFEFKDEEDENLANDEPDEYKEYDHDIDYLSQKDLTEGIDKPENKFKDEENLDFFNGYGGFSKEDGSYIIKIADYKNTPAPWINVMSNEDFGCHISESGSSYTWCGNSRENKITPWSNDYIRDPLSEGLYIRDDIANKSFSITPKPIRDEGEYIIKHSFGYSEFKHTTQDIDGNLQVFIPKDETVKIQIVTLENLSSKNRELSLFYYAKLVLGVYAYDSSKYITTNIIKNNDQSYIYGVNPYSKYFGKRYAYLTILGGSDLSFTGDNKEFIGINGEMENPEGLKYSSLSNTCGSIYDPCLTVSTKVTLKKGESKQLVILLGQEEDSEIENIIEKYSEIENAVKKLEDTKEYWKSFIGNIQVETPDKSMDYMLNGWFLYQTLSCRYLSRSAFYQSGGAYGFRDQLQDSMSLGVVAPSITKSQIIRSASRQYLEGDVQHWWHPVINSGIRTRFSDDLLWLPYVTAEYINSTGDYDILDETAPYLEDEPLREGEDERYTIVNQSSKSGTIYEHCKKAIEKSLRFGIHNIPLMGSGDWNDGMSTVGNKGKGESVWLGWFIYSILSNFIEIAAIKNDADTKKYYEEKKEFIKENLEKNAWDGGWYRRAYFDDGTPLGSRENPECQIDSLAQSWAIISEASKSADNEYTERALECMEAVDKNLVKKDKGMILLLAPPFNNSHLEPGYIKGYVPGVRENGGQYTHAAVWVILALTKLNLGNKAEEYYNMINPINHTKTELECMNYKLEPYVMAADVYIKEPHGGRGGWSWYTGASGWMYRVGVENILGIKKVKDKGYIIKPCVPDDWNEYKIKIKNDTEDYTIAVKRKEGDKTTGKVIINGKVLEDNIIPRNLGLADVEVYF